MHTNVTSSVGGDNDPLSFFGASLGDIGQGLSGLGSVVGGVTDFLNFGEIKKDARRNFDLALGNFANQAQTVNFAQEADIRTRLGNQGIVSGPELEAMVAQELARTGVSSDPFQAANGVNPSATPAQAVASQGGNFLPSLPAGQQAPTSGFQVNPQQPQQQAPFQGLNRINNRRPGAL